MWLVLNQQIATQYNNYQELLIDLDIFGRQSETKQLDLQGYEELFYEEFKQRKPMPTMESKRYKLSRLVDNDYRVEYNKQIELREKEYLIDLTEHSEKKEEKEEYEIIENVQELFTYEKQINDSDREEIIKKYSLDTGESLDYTQIERPDKLLGTIKVDESLKLDDIEIENLGSDNPVFHDEDIEPIEEQEEPDIEESEEEQELADLEEDFDTVDFDDSLENSSTSDDEQETLKDSSTSSISDLDNEQDSSDYDTDLDNEPDSSISSITDNNTEDSSTSSNELKEKEKSSSNDLSLDSLLQMLGNKLDANIDIEQLKVLVKESEKPKAEESKSIIESNSVEESEESITESNNVEETEEQDLDTLDDFFEEDETEEIEESESESESITEDSNIEESEETKESNLEDFDIDVDDFEMDFDDDEKPKEKPKPVVEQKSKEQPKIIEEQKQEQPKPVIEEKPKEQKQYEPKDLREFIRKHPRCEYDFATQYFTPKQIAMEIKKGRVIKRGNLLKI